MLKLSVVVPVYRNETQLEELHRRVAAALGSLPDVTAEIVFVDDGSPDGSCVVLARLAERDASVKVVSLSRNFGSNAAILAGLGYASGEVVCVIAADLQDPPELLPELLARWREGAEVVVAARRRRDDPLGSRLAAAVFNRLFRAVVFPEFPRDGFDFVLLDRRVASALAAMPEKHSYLFGQIYWLGFRRVVVYYDRAARAGGASSWTFWRKVKYFLDAFTAFSYLPVRAASALGIALAAIGFVYAVVVAVKRLLGDIPVPGFAALMVVLLIVSGTQLLITGLIGEYLWRVLEEARPRPPFVVARTLNLGEDGPGIAPEGRP